MPYLKNIFSFVGVDTDCGKTVAVAGLLKACCWLGINAKAIKPVQTGCSYSPQGKLSAPDLEVYAKATAKPNLGICLQALELACSPHLANKNTKPPNQTLSVRQLAQSIKQEAAKAEITLVEGAGGLLTPLNITENSTETLADLFQKLSSPAVLVVANKLGAINHALLSIEAMRSRGIELKGFILNNLSPLNNGDKLEELIRKDNHSTIAKMGGLPCLAELPYLAELHSTSPELCNAAWAELATLLSPVLQLFFNQTN